MIYLRESTNGDLAIVENKQDGVDKTYKLLEEGDYTVKVIDLNEHYIDFDSPATYIQGIYDMMTHCYQNNKVVAISNFYMADGMTGNAKPGSTMITFFPTNLMAGHDEAEHDCYLCWLYHDLLMGGLQFIITDDDYVDHQIV